jgi:hypothetical protein
MNAIDDVAIIRGRASDYRPLARFHYRAGPPATCVQTLCACDQLTGEVVGALTVSVPTLNGSWRAQAWPRVFGNLSKQKLARRINVDLRTISRVIVDPRYRALGIARRLVGAYLADPLTDYTETIASMGRWCPLFARAGMREIHLAPSPRDARLSNELARAGVAPLEMLEVGRAASVIRASPRIREALRTWAQYSRSTRRYANEESPLLDELAVLAGARLAARPLVFVSP